jgi:hypothetical protein
MPTRPNTTLEPEPPAPALTRQALCRRWSKAIRELFDDPNSCPPKKPRTVVEFFVHHMTRDPLIAWAFAPGRDRQEAPGGYERFKAAAREWAKTLENETWCQTLTEERP